MRKDMAKVITEKPRHGTRLKDRKGTKREFNRVPDEDKQEREGGNLRRKWIKNHADHKEFGEHLGPLRRFALSCIGRNWDDVYSEVCKYINKGNVVQNHILTHLFQYIARDVKVYKDGVYHTTYPFSKVYGAVVYVDPETKIICRVPERLRRRKAKPKQAFTRWVDTKYNKFYLKDVEGIWWECWLRKTPEPYYVPYTHERLQASYPKGQAIYPYIYDQFIRTTLRANSHYLLSSYGVSKMYCYKKLQLNKREIRRIEKELLKEQ